MLHRLSVNNRACPAHQNLNLSLCMNYCITENTDKCEIFLQLSRDLFYIDAGFRIFTGYFLSKYECVP